MYTNYIITGIILAAIVYLFLRARARMKNIPLVIDHEKILTLTEANFQHQIKNKLVLVDFWASWCAPCRVMGPEHTYPHPFKKWSRDEAICGSEGQGISS